MFCGYYRFALTFNNCSLYPVLSPTKRGDLGLTSKSVVEAKGRAEAVFKKKEIQLREAAAAMAEYQAANRAVAERTARLRQLRLAQEAAEAAGKVNKPIA